jgi:cytochrome c oxidase assembly protein subunit 15
LWGRLIGLAFLGPLIWLAATRRIERRLIGPLFGLFVLGGLQGAVGWFMVASGFLPDATAVSPARLTVHLALALLLYSALIWIGLTVLRPVATTPRLRGATLPMAILALVSVALTIVAGGFVAGTHAGLDYNTFPLMDGHIVPEGYARLSPFIRNLVENIAAVQFNHRLLASLTVASVGGVVFAVQRSGHGPILRIPAMALGIAVVIQYLLGVETLLHVVPLPLAALHQVGATILLTSVLVLLHLTIRPPPRPSVLV